MLPLDGIKVLDLSRVLSGPFCGMLLGDLGAEVIKVESPKKGEFTRSLGPFYKGESLYTMVLNRNKKSLTLDLRSGEGKKILHDLIKWADIIIENFKPGVMAKIGFDYDKIMQIDESKIMLSISGFGQGGPLSHKPGFDAIAQAMSGIMSLTGEKDNPPLIAGTFIVDFLAALYGTIGILTALREREKSGKGQHIDVSLLDAGFSTLLTALPAYKLLNEIPKRIGNRDRYAAPVNSFKAKDGFVYINAGNQKMWENLCYTIKRDDLLKNPKFKTNKSRLSNVVELEKEISNWVKKYKKMEVMKIMDEVSVPCGPILELPEVFNLEQLQYREQILEYEHPKLGKITLPGFPIKFSRTKQKIRFHPPSIGEQNSEILINILNYTSEEIKELLKEGVI